MNSDDWETDPDFERKMSEIEQRWGSKRTIGSIDMSGLMRDVTLDHEKLREKFGHASQRDHSHGFGGDFGVQTDRKDSSAVGYDYCEKLSKHSSQQSSTSMSKSISDEINKTRNEFLNKFESNLSPTSQNKNETFVEKKTEKIIKSEEKKSTFESAKSSAPSSIRDRINNFQNEMTNRMEQLKREANESTSGGLDNGQKSGSTTTCTKTIGPDGSQTITTIKREQFEKSNHNKNEFVDKKNVDIGKTSIKSLSEKFENLGKSSPNVVCNQKIKEKKSKFFDEIQRQIDEGRQWAAAHAPQTKSPSPTKSKSPTVKFNLDENEKSDHIKTNGKVESQQQYRTSSTSPSGFGTALPTSFRTPSSTDFGKSSPTGFGRKSTEGIKTNSTGFTTTSPTVFGTTSPTGFKATLPTGFGTTSPTTDTSRSSTSPKVVDSGPKVFSVTSVKKEETVTKIVKEGDRVIEHETKRHVESSSSQHGDTDDDNDWDS